MKNERLLEALQTLKDNWNDETAEFFTALDVLTDESKFGGVLEKTDEYVKIHRVDYDCAVKNLKKATSHEDAIFKALSELTAIGVGL